MIKYICLFLALFSLKISAQPMEVYSDCMLSFVSNSEWKVMETPSFKNDCTLVVTHQKGKGDVEVKLAAEFLYEAYDLGFDFILGKWVTVGRQGSKEQAEMLDTDVWSGLIGVVNVGVHNAKGFNGFNGFLIAILREKEVHDGVSIKLKANNLNALELESFVKLIKPYTLSD